MRRTVIPSPKPVASSGNGITVIGLNQSSFLLWAGNIAPLYLNYLNKTGYLANKMHLEDMEGIKWVPALMKLSSLKEKDTITSK